MEEFVDISKLEATYDKQLDLGDSDDEGEGSEEKKPVYQIQGVTGESNGYLMEIGKATNVSTIMINEFELSPLFTGRLLSFVFQEERLKDPKENTWVPMIRLQILKTPKKRRDVNQPIPPTEDLGSFIFSFHTFDHLKQNKQLFDLRSTHTNRTKLSGFFSIKFHCQKGVQNIETVEKFPGNRFICHKLVEYGTSVDTKKYLLKLIKRNG